MSFRRTDRIYTSREKGGGRAFRELKAAKEWSCLIHQHEGCPGEPHTKAQLTVRQGRVRATEVRAWRAKTPGWSQGLTGTYGCQGSAGLEAVRLAARAPRPRIRGDLKGTEGRGVGGWVNKGRPETGRLSGRAAPAGPWQRRTWVLPLPGVPPRPRPAASGRRTLRNFLAQPDAARRATYARVAAFPGALRERKPLFLPATRPAYPLGLGSRRERGQHAPEPTQSRPLWREPAHGAARRLGAFALPGQSPLLRILRPVFLAERTVEFWGL